LRVGEHAAEEGSFIEELNEDKREDCREFDEDVDGGSRGILKRITDGITDNGSLVFSRSLLSDLSVNSEVATFDIFLGIVPSTAGVGGGDSH
jgi:hypothetical protein